MDDSLLDRSHTAGIQALKFQRKGLFELAIERHLLAAQLLTELQKQLPSGNTLVTNLKYFIDHHHRQAQLDEVIVSYQKKVRTTTSTMNVKPVERPKTDTPRRHEPFRVFEEPDSLLPISVSSPMTPKYTVRPKSDAEIIEEYKMMIQNLKSVVAKQAEELMEARKKSQKDNETIRDLKLRLEKYESSSSIFNASQYIPASIPELPPLEQPPDCDFGTM